MGIEKWSFFLFIQSYILVAKHLCKQIVLWVMVQGGNRALWSKPEVHIWFLILLTEATICWNTDVISQFRYLIKYLMLSQIANLRVSTLFLEYVSVNESRDCHQLLRPGFVSVL
uniref:Putative secreted protein n=1 Tax=Ixodes ricinus TaxID=34613 RepID=A0A6B0UKD2_IXORI